jgi:CBS domain containing-hemolysin-like protein/mannitol/fructose-specific phosphotransferase system IIA component
VDDVEIFALSLVFVVLLALNAFFVLAEFAIVRVRPSRVSELIAAGDARAVALAGIQRRMDDYLGVCQVGITLASIALGMVGKKATDVIMGHGHDGARYALAIGLSFILVSGSHIVLGEQVPKFIGIRVADRAALWSVRPLRFFRMLFLPALWVLTGMANGILRMLGVRQSAVELHSEDELRILLDQSQERGMMSFRRLIFFENVFDFGELAVRDAMRARSTVRCLDVAASWAENLERIRASRFTRYPLLQGDVDHPIGFVHLKDLVIRTATGPPDLRSVARPLFTTSEATTLESLLSEMQRRRMHAAVVTDQVGAWTGFITLEDVIEELVGTIRDEFEDEEPVSLAETLKIEQIQLDIDAPSPLAAVRAAVARLPPATVPGPVVQLLSGSGSRERIAAAYLGQGIGLPHARVVGLGKPFVMILRSTAGVPFDGTAERGHLLFVLFTPAGQPRVHQRLQAVIATLLHESEYVKERLLSADSPHEVLEVIRTGEQAVLD